MPLRLSVQRRHRRELAKLKESGIKMSIVLADNPKDNSLEGKMKVIEEALALAKKLESQNH